MTEFLVKHFVSDSENIHSPEVRQRYGTMSGIVGICLNLILFIGKFIAGTISASIAITADAFNNLSDTGSSIVTLLGFRLAGQKPDRGHPFGHGRIEYLSGLVVSIAILLMGYELARSSIDKVLHPQAVEFSILSCVILVFSILIKTWMCFFNKKLGERIHSSAMVATSSDSLSDSVATTTVLIGTLIGHFSGLKVDGWFGILVALFILFTGFKSLKDTIGPLLGQAPDAEIVKEIRDTVLAHPEIRGIHDLIIHDYGPGRLFASLHAEISKDSDIMQAHDVIDNIEREIYQKVHCETSIHMDPIAVNDARLEEMKQKVARILAEIDPEITFHDFRMTDGPSHINLIFDVVKPMESKYSDEEMTAKIHEAVASLDGNYYAVITIDTMRI